MGDDFDKEYAELASLYQRASSGAKTSEGRRMARADYDEAVREVAMRQQSAQRSVPRETPRQPASVGAGVARAAAQGATFGFGDEAEALVRSLSPNRTYGEEVGKIRGQMSQFREENPKLAIGSEIVGGLAVPGIGAGRAVKAGLSGATEVAQSVGALRRAAGAAAGRSAALGGALSGAGTAEGGLGERALGAGVGAVAGGVLGGALGYATGATTRGAVRAAQGDSPLPSAGIEEVLRLSESSRVNLPAVLTAAQGRVSPETRVMDVIGPQAVRRATGIRTAGGESGGIVEQAMQDRLARTPERLQQAAFSTGRQTENVVQSADELVRLREEASRPLYETALAGEDVVDDEIEGILKTPLFAEASRRAERMMQNARQQVAYLDTPEGRVPVRTPEFLDNVKKGLDDLIYNGRLSRGTAESLGPGELRQAKMLRKEFVERLDAHIPGYAEARAAFAGPTALKDALEMGVEAGAQRVDPDQLAAELADLGEGEREFFQRGFINALRRQIDEGQLKPAAIQVPAFLGRMRAVFGDEGEAVANALREEVGLSANAQRTIGGSQTAANASDVAGLEGGSFVGNAIRGVLRPRETALRALDATENRVRQPFFESRRQSVANTLMTPVDRTDELRAEIRREHLARVLGTAARNVTASGGGRVGGAGSVRAVQGQ